MTTLSPAPDTSGSEVEPTPPAHSITWPQVTMTVGVLVFTGWMLTRGYDWYLALLIASCAVVVGTGLAYVPRPVARIVRAIGRYQE